MTDFKAKLTQQRDTSQNAGFVLFTNRYSSNSQIHYIFCESRDDIQFFEQALARSFAEQKFDFIPCNGKSLVLSTRKRIHTLSYEHNRISYIVDRDHDGYLKETAVKAADVYVTDFYSVESYLCSETVFAHCIQQFCGIHCDDPVLNVARSMYSTGRQTFIDTMLKPMATTIVYRRMGGPDSIHFGNLSLHQFLTVLSDGSVANKGDLTSAISAAWAGTTNSATTAKATRLSATLSKQRPELWVRGKFLSWWYARAFNNIGRALASTHRDRNGGKIHNSLTMGDSHFISLTKIHAECPKSLRTFFKRRLALGP